MKSSIFQKSRQTSVFLIVALFFAACSTDTDQPERNLDFNEEWLFQITDDEGAYQLSYDDSGWQATVLPHDWSIMDYKKKDSLHIGPFYKNQAGGVDVAYQRTGTAWYRKYWKTPRKLDQQQVLIHFDGVQTQMELWVNETKVGENVYGYTPFYFNITDHLKKEGDNNVIAVKTVNTGENSRWFAGAGIFREVTLSMIDPVAFAEWGLQMGPLSIENDTAHLQIAVRVNNLGDEATTRHISLLLQRKAQKIQTNAVEIPLEAAASLDINFSLTVPNPELWDLENPALYEATAFLFENGLIRDSYKQKIGIRTSEFSPEEGFMLNGKNILLKGACMHHDNGILGAAAFRDAEYRRVRIMKENGYNAIRTSHNPPSSYFLDACDELGMLVINEAFDHWIKPKRANDYSNYFEEWHRQDVQSMVLRDRNHPSVIMWSFGNEVQERADPEGIEIAKELIGAIREVDPHRPVTQAICDFWDNPGKEWKDTEGAFALLDVHGYNYQFKRYEEGFQNFPERIIYGSESVPKHAWENWEEVKKHSYVIGDFVWTGMDYLGESGIGHTKTATDPDQETYGLMPWPWYIAWCGDIDIIGNKKPQSYYRDIVWGERKLAMMVKPVLPEGKYELVSYWGWPDVDASWNFNPEEHDFVEVTVYSAYPEIELEVNGEKLGSKKLTQGDKYTAHFKVPYAPGEVKVLAYEDGEFKEAINIKTAEEVSSYSLLAETQDLRAEINSLAFIKVEARDRKGILNPDCNETLHIELEGPATLQAAGSASPLIQGSLQDNELELYKGKGLIVLRSSGEEGEVILTVRDQDGITNQLKINALKE